MKKSTSIRVCVGAVSVALLLSGCTKSSTSGSGSKGGTLYILTQAEQILHLDPQRNYTGEDLAFASGFLNRTLTQYTLSKDNNTASKLVADLATDTGTSSDNSKTWAFTLRDGVKWEDGKPVTCADVAYGVSRTFATDVITDGPTYAISLLDIAKNSDGSSQYPGPYKATAAQQALFDKAVSCEGNKITFKLANPAADFNYSVTLSAFAPVRKDKDTGEKYDDTVLSDGPYKIQSYVKKSKLILVRNPNWSASTDSLRPAYPDVVEYDFAVPPLVITQRLMADAGNDSWAISPDGVEPTQLAVVFNDAKYANRRLNDYDPYVRYLAINTKKVPILKQRQAILAAVNRAELRTIAGGTYAGDYADGVVKPNIGQDYAPTGLWDGLLGDTVSPKGNVVLAKKLLAESGKPFPNPLVFDYAQSPTADKSAASIVASLARVGIVVKPNPLESGAYYGVVLDPAKQGGMSAGGWGPDWSNASTVIPELFTPAGGFNLSQYDDAAFTAECQKAKAISDRAAQAKAWQALNTKAAQLALVLPTRFGKEQRIQGSKVNGAYIWGPYGSYPYGALSVSK
jgi:peptide/nickel transport system substrate-binding protein